MRKTTKQVAKAVGIGVIDTLAVTGATSGVMHRGKAHPAYKPGRAVELAARTIIWGNGMQPRYWAAVHRKHHEYSDQPGDPHSPVLEGKYGIVKLWLKNPFKYRQAVHDEKESGNPLPADLQPDKLDRAIYDKTKLGLRASFMGHIALNKLVGNPGYMAAVSWPVSKLGYVFAGNSVNSISHGGERPFHALLTGKITPHADGTYGADNRLLAIATLGEGLQKRHHEYPNNLVFSGAESPLMRAVEDPVGWAAMQLIHLGLAQEVSTPPEPAPLPYQRAA